MAVLDSHRHIGLLPEHPFYGGPALRADLTARATVAELIADLDRDGIERALVLPNYGVPVPHVAFELNHLALEAAQTDDRLRCGLWVSPRASDTARNEESLSLAREEGVAALKTSFLLGGHPTDEDCAEQLERIFTTAAAHQRFYRAHLGRAVRGGRPAQATRTPVESSTRTAPPSSTR